MTNGNCVITLGAHVKDFLAALVIIILLAAFIEASHRKPDMTPARCEHSQSQSHDC